MKYQASISINATASTVWSILIDSSRYPDWEPNITKVDGEIALNQQITVHTKLSDRAFPVTVAQLTEAQKMQWVGGLPLGLFKGVRTFSLRPQDTQTVFEMNEVFSGPLLFLMRRMMPDLQPSFDAFAQALKAKAEA